MQKYVLEIYWINSWTASFVFWVHLLLVHACKYDENQWIDHFNLSLSSLWICINLRIIAFQKVLVCYFDLHWGFNTVEICISTLVLGSSLHQWSHKTKYTEFFSKFFN